MGVNFDALPEDAKKAVEWKAKQNLSMALASGSTHALGNQKKFLENNCESLATNAEGLRHVLKEFKDNGPRDDD